MIRVFRHSRTIPRWLLPLIDVVILNAVTTVAFLVRFLSFPPAYNWEAYLRLFPWDAGALVVIFYIYGLYGTYKKTSADLKQTVATAVIVNGFATLAITFLATTIGFPRSVFLISAFIQVPVFLVWRLFHRSLSLREGPDVNVLLVCPESDLSLMTQRAGQFLPRITITRVDPDGVLPDLDRVGAILIGREVSRDARSRYFLEALSRDIPCLWMPDNYDLLASGAQLTELGGAPYFQLPSVRIQRGSLVVKRLADIVLASLGLVLLSPFMAIIGMIIRLTSPGPALYSQDRVTVGGRVFPLYKFRTMVQDAESATGPVLATPDDARVTRFGQFLRTTHIDELPQLWNILRGDMSLVGPRPERPVFVDRFRNHIPHYDLRHQSPPGLTGWAQVAGGYHASAEEKAAFDLHYAKNHNFLKDLWLILRTAFQPPSKGTGA